MDKTIGEDQFQKMEMITQDSIGNFFMQLDLFK